MTRASRYDSREPHERILDRSVSALNSCVVFTGTPSQPYGCITYHGKRVLAFRAVYEALVGKIPEGKQLDHLCSNTRCVNPYHLEPVTMRENILRGGSPSAQNARKTHCVHGHLFDDRNTYVNPRGSRQCRICNRIRAMRHRLK